MGDMLRDELGIALKWSLKEKREYFDNRRKELGPVYMQENLSLDSPHERVRYLDEKLEIENGGRIEKSTMSISKRKGRGFALVFLEELVIEKYF